LNEGISLHVVITRAGCGMRINEGLHRFNSFPVCENDDQDDNDDMKEG
jgi:hypothetical protein